MADKKIYLDQEGLERLVDYIKNELGQKADKGDIIELPADLVYEDDLVPYAKKSEVIAQLPNDLVYDADIADVVREAALDDYATKDDLEAVEAKATSAYHVKGSVANIAALSEIENPAEGDVYNLEDTGINAVWTGSEWDELGTFVDISPLLPKADVYPISMSVIDSILYSGPRAVVADEDGLFAMVANDEPEVEIIINDDIDLVEPIAVPAGKSVTVDLGGNVLSANDRVFEVTGGELVLENGAVEADGRPVVVFDGELVLNGAEVNSTSDVAISATGENSSVVMNDGKVTAQESGVLVTTGASLEMNGGEIECWDNCPIQGNGSSGQGDINVVMNGGKLTAHIQSNGYIACAVYMPNSGSFTMNGGEIESDGAGIVMRGGQVNLNGGSVVASGATGTEGKVGDSRVVVGPYAVVYDSHSKYPAKDTLELNIAHGVSLQGTDGDIQILLQSGDVANINDNR